MNLGFTSNLNTGFSSTINFSIDPFSIRCMFLSNSSLTSSRLLEEYIIYELPKSWLGLNASIWSCPVSSWCLYNLAYVVVILTLNRGILDICCIKNPMNASIFRICIEKSISPKRTNTISCKPSLISTSGGRDISSRGGWLYCSFVPSFHMKEELGR